MCTADSRARSSDFAWSPDSKWIAYARSMPNHLHAIFLYSLDSGQSTQVTSAMGDSRQPAFDRDGKYLYFLASTNAGATSDGLDMTSDLYQVTSNIYALTLAADTASPIAPEMDDEKAPADREDGRRKGGEKKSDGDQKPADAKEGSGDEKAHAKPAPKPVKVDLDGIEKRIVALPLPASVYTERGCGAEGQRLLHRDRGVGPVRGSRSNAEPLDSGGSQDREAGGACGGIRALGERREDAARAGTSAARGRRDAAGRRAEADVGDCAGECAGEGRRRRAVVRRCEDARGSACRVGADVSRGVADRARVLLRSEFPRNEHSRGREEVRAVCGVDRVARGFELHLPGDAERVFRWSSARQLAGRFPMRRRCRAACWARTTRSRAIATASRRSTRAASSIRARRLRWRSRD